MTTAPEREARVDERLDMLVEKIEVAVRVGDPEARWTVQRFPGRVDEFVANSHEILR